MHPNSSLQSVYVIGRSGKVVGGTGPPGLAFNHTDARSITGKPILTLSKGHYPQRLLAGGAGRGHRPQGRVRRRRPDHAGDPR